MKTRTLIAGLRNSQRIRVICNGVGFHTTVAGAFDMCIYEQRIAVSSVLSSLGASRKMPGNQATGLATRIDCYTADGRRVAVDVQVDLV
jgi:hypothetical protein